MINKFLLAIASIFILNSCSVDSILALGKINKIQQVRHTKYTKEYRAYFARNNLRYIKSNHKYIIFYNKRKKDLAILLKDTNEFILYSINRSSKQILSIDTSKRHNYRYVLKVLRKYGYKQVQSPISLGYSVSVSKRIFKGIKTYYLRVIDYTKLINRYKTAIKTYNSNKIQHIKTRLPKRFIESYFNHYYKKAKTAKQKQEITIIGTKLNILKKQSIPQKPIDKEKTEKQPEDTHISLYDKYKHCKTYAKLHKFLISKEAKQNLSYADFSKLSYKEAQLREIELLKSGTIEELIAEYKKTNNPRYKTKAMELMKKK